MKRHALFVGVDDYADPTIQNLEYPSEDAAELASVFRRLLKFDRVEKLINPAHAAEVLDCVDALTGDLGPGDLLLFFFAGHGFRVKENHVLVCAKDKYSELEDEYDGLPVGRLKKRMRGAWSRMLVLDACQNDIRTTRGADTGFTGRDLKLIHTPEFGGGDSGCQIVVTSCSEGQKALEVSDLRHGLFTSALLDSVTSFADARRRIDLEALRADLGARMGELIVRYHLSGEQMPLFTMPPNAAGIVLLDGAAQMAPFITAPAASSLVVCPVCGKKNDPKETFRCLSCGRDNLCLGHQDKTTYTCTDCTEKNTRKAELRTARENICFVLSLRLQALVAAERKANEAGERKVREEAERKAYQVTKHKGSEETFHKAGEGSRRNHRVVYFRNSKPSSIVIRKTTLCDRPSTLEFPSGDEGIGNSSAEDEQEKPKAIATNSVWRHIGKGLCALPLCIFRVMKYIILELIPPLLVFMIHLLYLLFLPLNLIPEWLRAIVGFSIMLLGYGFDWMWFEIVGSVLILSCIISEVE